MFYTYILFSKKLNKYYIGSSNNPQKRLVRHNAGHTPFTKTGIPWIIVYQECFSTRMEAYRRGGIKKAQNSVSIPKPEVPSPFN